MIITIDGPAGVGKTTISRSVAENMQVAYLDSGAMFRAIALSLGQESWTWPEDRLLRRLGDFCFSLEGVGQQSRLLQNDVPLSEAIRSEAVGIWASHLGRLPCVREKLKQAQQALGRDTDLVAEGRDMGTVVFPEAAYKFFLEADPRERARRRFRQLKAMSVDTDFKELVDDIQKRDQQDRNRSVAPLQPARDALLIDTTALSQEAVLRTILQYLQ